MLRDDIGTIWKLSMRSIKWCFCCLLIHHEQKVMNKVCFFVTATKSSFCHCRFANLQHKPPLATLQVSKRANFVFYLTVFDEIGRFWILVCAPMRMKRGLWSEIYIGGVICHGNKSGLDIWRLCNQCSTSSPFRYLSGWISKIFWNLKMPDNQD